MMHMRAVNAGISYSWLAECARARAQVGGSGTKWHQRAVGRDCDRVCPGRGADEVVRDRAAGAAGAAGADDKEVASGR